MVRAFALYSELKEYLRNKIDEKNIQTVFISGSTPNIIKEQADIDVFIVIREKNKEIFFTQLEKAMQEFCAKYKKVTWSMYKGPLKYEHKGLIHCIIYTDGPQKEGDNLAFLNEHRLVLKGILANYTLIKGEDPKEMLRRITIEDNKEIAEFKKSMIKRRELLRERGYIEYRIWKQVRGEWDLVKKKIKVNEFLRKYLEEYYAKNIAR